MIFYWIILFLKQIVWFFRIPKPEELAKANRNERCPVCGHEDGRMRCVLRAKPGPRVQGRIVEGQILRQHKCNECGARWHHAPLVKNAETSKILPSVARDEFETKEDRMVFNSEEFMDITGKTST